MRQQDEVLEILRTVFRAGRLSRLPRNPEHAEVLMAHAALTLKPDGFYDEVEINEHLRGWLSEIALASADHLTLRRALVDAGFLRRATDGVIYVVEQQRIARVYRVSDGCDAQAGASFLYR